MPTTDHDSLRLADELHARRRDLDMVMRAIHRLLRNTQARPLYEAIARVGGEALGTDRCSVLVKAPDCENLIYGGSLGLSPGLAQLLSERGIPLDSNLPPAIAFRELRPAAFSNLADDQTLPEEFRKSAIQDEIRAIMCVPVVAEGEPLGVLVTYYRESRPFHPDEVRRLSLLAEICAVAVQNVTAFEHSRKLAEELSEQADALEKRNAELHVVADLAPTLAVAESSRQILQAFYSRLVTLVPFEQVALLRMDKENPKELVIREVHSASPAAFGKGWRVAWDGTLAEEPLVARKATWHALSAGGNQDPLARYCMQLGLRRIGLFPLIAGREVLGLLIMGTVRPDSLDASAVSTLEPIAAQLAGAFARLDET
ncbi:MAG: GAF domain-containing protein [Candidatus Sericytochromatia bacterium]|uniref:GAF domain-containing protein n=1 Tax=Candidatus Tanganyikabacteria bacterium TaxID=2961651 RepID=A0A937X713_9BACT|nr:GAF domain-containing protein [Candidatus Tanganyikabacteria bacterium]